MENILVYATPFEIQKDKWGYKWIGFCNEKRFTVIQDPNGTMSFDEEKGIYLFSENNQRELLPSEILKLTYEKPLSNKYFLSGKGKEVSIEVVMMLIENGYDIEKITMQKFLSYSKRNEEPYLCQYKNDTEIIIEILNNESVLWKGVI